MKKIIGKYAAAGVLIQVLLSGCAANWGMDVSGYNFKPYQLNESVATSNVLAGQSVTFTLTVTTDSTGTLTDAKISDTLPEGLTFVGSDEPHTSEGYTVTWVLGDIPANTTTSRHFTAMVGQGVMEGTVITNSFDLSSKKPTASSNTAQVTVGFAVVPDPFRLSGLPGQPLQFSYLSPGGTIEIDSYSGQMVTLLNVTGPSLSWDGRDANGKLVQPGFYYYSISGGVDGVARKGKIEVVP